MARKHGTAAERFFAHVERHPDGCWLWHGEMKESGYGIHWVDRQRRWMRAHRYAHELMIGTIPSGFVVDHLCENKRCVNPDHLEAVTQAENVRRYYARRTHCSRGHERTGPGPCQECCRIRGREHYRRSRVG